MTTCDKLLISSPISSEKSIYFKGLRYNTDTTSGLWRVGEGARLKVSPGRKAERLS